MNEKLKFFLIGAGIVLIFVGAYLGFQYEKNKYYNIGVFEGQSYIIQSISATGNIPYYENLSGNLTVKTIPIQQLCNQLNQKVQNG